MTNMIIGYFYLLPIYFNSSNKWMKNSYNIYINWGEIISNSNSFFLMKFLLSISKSKK